MKKSNKLLLVGFSIGLIMIAAIHITLYAKYKNGDYTIYNPEDDQVPNSMELFPNILFVSIRNVPGASIRFADVAQVEKGQEDIIDYVRNGDTLLIRGKDSVHKLSLDIPVMLNLPYKTMLSVYNSSLNFYPGKNISQINPVLHLQHSNIIFSGEYMPFSLEHVKLDASDHSAILFHSKTNVNQMEVRLMNSRFEYDEGELGELSIETDSVSRIALPSKLLMKANIKIISQ
ncbi:MAG: hypothetical protein ACJ75F_09645 [Flavisolibacter sp.]